MKFGEKLIYMDRWPFMESKILYYLFDLPNNYDPLHDVLCSTDEKYLANFPDFESYIKNRNNIIGNELYYIDSLKHCKVYSDSEYKNQSKILDYFKKNSKTFEILFGTQWDFYDDHIRTFEINYCWLKFQLITFKTINAIKYVFSYILIPLFILPFLEFYFLFLNYKEYQVAKLKLKINLLSLENFEKYALSASQLKEKIKLESKCEKEKSELSRLRELLVASNRAISTLILGALTTVSTALYYQNKEEDYNKNIEMLKNKIESIQNENRVKELEILNFKIELSKRQANPKNK